MIKCFTPNTIVAIVSVISLFVSIKALRDSSKVNKLDYRLKELELKRIEEERNQKKEPTVEARLSHISNNKNRLVVWNSGDATAYDVTVDIQDAGIFIMNDVTPFEILEPGNNFEESIAITYSAASKFTIVTRWKDSEGKKNSKTQIRTLQ